MTVIVTPAPRVIVGGVPQSAVYPLLCEESDETLTLRATTHDVIDQPTPTVVRHAPSFAAGRLRFVCSSRTDAKALLALAAGALRVTDDSVTPTLDVTGVVSSASITPLKTAGQRWAVDLTWTASS